MNNNKEQPFVDISATGQGSGRAYVTGFATSLYLTLTAYFVTTRHLFGGWALIGVLMGLGVIQLLVQLVFFLHLGRESKPRWNLQVLVFAVTVVGIVVGGTLWIMSNLDYHHDLPADQSDRFIIQDEGYQP